MTSIVKANTHDKTSSLFKYYVTTLESLTLACGVTKVSLPQYPKPRVNFCVILLIHSARMQCVTEMQHALRALSATQDDIFAVKYCISLYKINVRLHYLPIYTGGPVSRRLRSSMTY